MSPYFAQTIAEDALHLHGKNLLEVVVSGADDEGELAEVTAQLANLRNRGMEIRVTRRSTLARIVRSSDAAFGLAGGPLDP
jgi:hypothetical protein